MSGIKAIEKLRESSHLDDEKWTLSDGRVMWVTNGEPSDRDAVNWGEQWRKLADEIEREVNERFMELPVDADGVPIHVGDYLQLAESRGHVITLMYCPCNKLPWEWQCDSDGDWYNTAFAHHAKPRKVEDVLRDVMTDFADADFRDETIEIITARYIGELRELMKEGGND